MTGQWAKMCIVTIFYIIICCRPSCAEDTTKLNKLTSEFALKFGEKWLGTPKLHIYLVLPNKIQFEMQDVIQLTKTMKGILGNNAYFTATTNITNHNDGRQSPGELFWFLFEMENYDDIDCNILEASRKFTTKQRYILFFVGNRDHVDFYFLYCKIRFDSNVVVYYKHNATKSLSFIIFEEIYKIRDHQNQLEKNVLGKINLNTKKMNLSGLKTYIWKRRSNLQGIKFNSITEISPPYVNQLDQSLDLYENVIVQPRGYFGDIMNHLTGKLNFTINTTLSEKPYNYTYIIESVANGKYDVGYTMFVFNRFRRELVDFSYGITPISFALFYVKTPEELHLNVFLKSFRIEAWNSLIIYVVLLIVGFLSITLIMEHFLDKPQDSEHSMFKEALLILQMASNFALRSVIGKRLGSEPDWCSTKIAFSIIVLAGFFVISVYRAMLVAFVAVEIDTPPIESLNELRRSIYLLAVQRDTYMDSIFLNATPGSAEDKLQQANKTIRFGDNITAFVDKMVSNEPPNAILFCIDKLAEFSKHYPCTLSIIKSYQQNSKQSSGMVYKKDWPFTNLFNYHLLIMKESGIIDKFFRPYLKVSKHSCPTEQIIRPTLNIPRPVSTNTAFSLYLIIPIGFCSAFVFLLIEKIHHKYSSNTFN